MHEFLLFQLYGPLASWGKVAVGEVRPSALRPSRSALLGLLGAALGLRREDDDAHRTLGEELRFGVHVVSSGLPLTDYHTIQARPRKKKLLEATRPDQLRGRRDELDTIVSTREYRCDACYRVVTWNVADDPDYPLARLDQALARPRFVLYLGRKSCPPGAPLSPRIVRAETLVDALASVNFPEIDHLRDGWRATGVEPGRELYWEGDESLAGVESLEQRERRDDPLSRRHWSFQRRREYVSRLPEPPTPEEATS